MRDRKRLSLELVEAETGDRAGGLRRFWERLRAIFAAEVPDLIDTGRSLVHGRGRRDAAQILQIEHQIRVDAERLELERQNALQERQALEAESRARENEADAARMRALAESIRSVAEWISLMEAKGYEIDAELIETVEAAIKSNLSNTSPDKGNDT